MLATEWTFIQPEQLADLELLAMGPTTRAEDVDDLAAYEAARRSLRLYQKEDWDGARQALEHVISRGEASNRLDIRELCAQAQFNLGVLYFERGDAIQAQSALEKTVAAGSEMGTQSGLLIAVRALMRLGLLLDALNEKTQAKEAFEQVVWAASPPSELSRIVAQAHLLLVPIHYSMGNLEAGRQAIDDGLAAAEASGPDARPEVAQAHTLLAALHQAAGEFGAAQAEYDLAIKAVRGAPGTEGLYYLAAAYIGLGQLSADRGDASGADRACRLAMEAAKKADTPYGDHLFERAQRDRQKYSNLTTTRGSGVMGGEMPQEPDELAATATSYITLTANTAFEPTPQDAPNIEYNPQVVRDLINMSGLDQKDFAAEIGVSPPSVTGWLQGSEPRAGNVIAMTHFAAKRGWSFDLVHGLSRIPEHSYIPE